MLAPTRRHVKPSAVVRTIVTHGCRLFHPCPPVLLDWGLRLSGSVFVQCLFTVELALRSKTPATAWVWWFHCCCVSKPGRQGHRADQNVPESRDLWKREMLLFAGTWQLPGFSTMCVFTVNSKLSKEV